MKQAPLKQRFSAKFYPADGQWQGRRRETTNSFAQFRAAAGANWKKWGQAHFEKHHRGTPVKEAPKSDE